MNGIIRPAFYARVSSQKQADEKTIQSQCDRLRKRVQEDRLTVSKEHEFLDDGYSGSELLRPALEMLRDKVAAGLVNRLYIYSVDRLARKMTHQLLLMEELKKYECEVIFLDQPERGDSPECTLFLNMQGVIAEYEREKILERTRRGRKYSASKGNVSVFSGAPYGYRYMKKADGGGQASWLIDGITSEHVKLIFDLVGNQGYSLSEVCRELGRRNIPTSTAKTEWNTSTIHGIVTNSAYCGEARFGKTRLVNRMPGRRASRGRPEVPRYFKVPVPTESSEQTIINVPVIIDRELFERVNQQMSDNKKRKREHCLGAKYLLSGKVLCGICGSAYCASRDGKTRYYYRCIGNDKRRAKNLVVCKNKVVTGLELESLVWEQLCKLLNEPNRIKEEYKRRENDPQYEQKKQLKQNELKSTQLRLDRLIDVYEEGALERSEFTTRTASLRAKKDQLTSELKDLQRLQHADQDYEAAGNTLDSLVEQVGSNLAAADWELKRTLVKLLVKQIEVHVDEIRIVYKVAPNPFLLPPANRGGLRHCSSRQARAGQSDNFSIH